MHIISLYKYIIKDTEYEKGNHMLNASLWYAMYSSLE